MNTQQPEALRLADRIKSSGQFTNLGELDAAAAELRRLHAELLQLHAENEALQQVYDARQLEIDHLRGVTKSKLLAQPVAWMVYLPSIDTQNVYDSQDDPGYVDDVTNHADAEVTPLYEMAATKAEVAPAGEYPPLPGASLWRDETGIRGYGTDPGTGPWYTAAQLHAYVDAARAAKEGDQHG